jgi:hypothetical protein
MSAAIKQNPSFISEDGDQIDVTFYPTRVVGADRRRKQIVEIRKDNAIQSVYLDPKDIPDLIDALRQVYDQFVEFNEPSAPVAE